MCRFLLARSKNTFTPLTLLQEFSAMANASRAFDGDWQGDGWGMSWLKNGQWEQYVSAKPIWEDTHMFSYAPETNHIVVHARSASFDQHKNTISFNQPFTHSHYAFVFNGLLHGVVLPYSLNGTIGSQKIFSLLKMFLSTMPVKQALEKTAHIINTNTRYIQALNIGVSDGKNIFAYNQFSKHPDYYTMRSATTNTIDIVSSEPIGKYIFTDMPQKTVHVW